MASSKTIYIITTAKQAIWLVNTRAGWDNPACTGSLKVDIALHFASLLRA